MLSGVWDRGWTTFACRENVIPLPCCFKISDNAQRVAGSTELIQVIRSPFGLLHYPVTCWYFLRSAVPQGFRPSSGCLSIMDVREWDAGFYWLHLQILCPAYCLDFTPPTSHTRRHWPHAPTGSIFRTLKETHLHYAWVYEAVYLNMTWCRGHWGFSRTLTW